MSSAQQAAYMGWQTANAVRRAIEVSSVGLHGQAEAIESLVYGNARAAGHHANLHLEQTENDNVSLYEQDLADGVVPWAPKGTR